MRYFFILSIYALIFTSCNRANFDTYPEPEIKQFPEEWQGKYKIKDKEASDSDYVIIKSTSFYFKTVQINHSTTLGDSIKLSKINDLYFLSSLGVENNIPVWEVYVLKPKGNHIHLYAIGDDKDQKVMAKFFQKTKDTPDCKTYKMDNFKLYNFSKKRIKTKKSMVLIKIKS